MAGCQEGHQAHKNPIPDLLFCTDGGEVPEREPTDPSSRGKNGG